MLMVSLNFRGFYMNVLSNVTIGAAAGFDFYISLYPYSYHRSFTFITVMSNIDQTIGGPETCSLEYISENSNLIISFC